MRIKLSFLIIILFCIKTNAANLWSARGFIDNSCYFERARLSCNTCKECTLDIFPNSKAQISLPVKGEVKLCEKIDNAEAGIFFKFYDKSKIFAEIISLSPISQKLDEILRVGESPKARPSACPRPLN